MNPVSRFINEIPADMIEGKAEKESLPFFNNQKRSTGFEAPAQPKRAAQKIKKKAASGGEKITWQAGDKAQHKKWGEGTVVKVQGEGEAMELDIAFPAPVGVKRLLAKFAPITKG